MSSRLRVGVVALVLITSGCTAAATPPAPASERATTSSASAPATPSQEARSVPHRYTSVPAIQASSPTFATSIVDRCTRTGSATTCHPKLFLTQDGGHTWANVTPPDIPSGSSLTNVTFLDQDLGWATISDCAAGRGALYRTTDGGRLWRHKPISSPSCNAGARVAPTFGDPLVGYLINQEPTGGGPADISRSFDGGRSWSRSQELPFQGPAEFTSASEGWAVGDPFAGTPALRHSIDGGHTWRRVPLPISRHVVALGLPIFTRSTGVLPATFHMDHRWGVEFLTTDGDGSWQRAATVRFATKAIYRLGVTGIAGPKAWWVANANGHIVRTANAGASWHRMTPPNDDPVVSLSPVDGRNAWAITEHGQRDRLWTTSNGGHIWRRVTPSERGHRPASAELRSVAHVPGSVGDLVAGPDGSVYATYDRGHELDRSGIARFDPTTGAVTHTSRSYRGQSLGAQHLVVAGGSVWFVSGRFTRSGTLVRLDASSLHLIDKIRFPASVVGIVSTPAGLWVGTARSVVLLDPGTGTVERRVPVGGHVTVLDADPSGRHLYVSTDTGIDHRDHVRFVEMDAWTGAVLSAPRDVGFADLLGPSGVTATDEGVWLATPTGMMGSLTFDREGDLTQIALYRPGGSNGISSSFAGDTLWIPNLRGGLTCADPVTGAVRGYVGAPTENLGPTNVIAAAGGLYVGGAEGSIDRILPDRRCIG